MYTLIYKLEFSRLLKQITFTLLTLTLFLAACGKDDPQADPIQNETIQGKWKVTHVEGKLFVNVPGIPETEAPLGTFWESKIFFFQSGNQLSVLEDQAEIFDFGPYTLSGNKLTVANYPGVLYVDLSDAATMKLTSQQDDYYRMMAFYTGQSEAELRQMYRVEGDIVFRLAR
ncbi:hypothetical protein [Parapedobacter lycopersici]|uniref:hypothetical protein n=1 Tax=Parapedobacter lycopersici TaxID=1864939 RepID=UPI00214DC9B0|nr:hypothetical protein [Parapedobacter lycopersici]